VSDSGDVVGAPRDSLERLTSYLGSLVPRPVGWDCMLSHITSYLYIEMKLNET